MLKKVLLLAGAVFLLASAVSAEIPYPPCAPDCANLISSAR
jgi:hypothetical protein